MSGAVRYYWSECRPPSGRGRIGRFRSRTGCSPTEPVVMSNYPISRRTFLTSATLPLAGGLTAATGGRRRAGREPVAFVRLRCGRRVAYAEYGDPLGTKSIIYNHGLPCCRLEAETYLDALAGFPGVRLIALDRPGVGWSDDDPGRDFLSWPADVAAVADALGIDRFAVMGTSGGTPYSLAVARAFPGRVTAVAIPSAGAPVEVVEAGGGAAVPAWRLAARHPRLAAAALTANARRAGRGRDPVPASYLAPADHSVLGLPGGREFVARIVAEAVAVETAGSVRDMALTLTRWGHWLKDVTTRVSLFHGCADRMAPPACSRYLVAALPNAEARFYPGEGHLSTPRNRAADVLAAAVR